MKKLGDPNQGVVALLETGLWKVTGDTEVWPVEAASGFKEIINQANGQREGVFH